MAATRNSVVDDQRHDEIFTTRLPRGKIFTCRDGPGAVALNPVCEAAPIVPRVTERPLAALILRVVRACLVERFIPL